MPLLPPAVHGLLVRMFHLLIHQCYQSHTYQENMDQKIHNRLHLQAQNILDEAYTYNHKSVFPLENYNLAGNISLQIKVG